VVLVGTYTSIFIAAPILIYLGVHSSRADVPETPAKKVGQEPKARSPA
jgi:preprotein translocase subunit SecF